jgi:hypothetical protein
VCVVLIVFFLGYQAFGWWLLNDMVRGLIPKEGTDFAFHAVVSLPIVVAISGLIPMLLLTALGTVFMAFSLAGELMICTKDDLLIHLLDRVEALEKYQQYAVGTDRPEGTDPTVQPGDIPSAFSS